MKFNWKEMSPSEKIQMVVLLILGAFALIFIFLDRTGKWPNNAHYLVLSALSLFECVTSWNKNRKCAILELVAAVLLALPAFI